jgi:hypothetical protein
MPQGLWVEHKTDIKTYLDWIPIKEYEFVEQFIREIKEDTQHAIPKNAKVMLHGPSGTAISVGDSISSLAPGNSSESPLRVQVSASPLITIGSVPDAELTSFWNSLHGLSKKVGFCTFPLFLHCFRTTSRYSMSKRPMKICSRSSARILRLMIPESDFVAWP